MSLIEIYRIEITSITFSFFFTLPRRIDSKQRQDYFIFFLEFTNLKLIQTVEKF